MFVTPEQMVTTSPQMGFLRRNKKALKQQLQHIEGQRQQDNPGIEHTAFQQFAFSAQQLCNGTDEHNAQHRKDNAHRKGNVGEQGKVLIGPYLVALPKRFGDNGSATGAKHEPYRG